MKADVPKFKPGEIVYHLADGARGVLSHVMHGDGSIEYRVIWGPANASICEGGELTSDYADVKALFEE